MPVDFLFWSYGATGGTPYIAVNSVQFDPDGHIYTNTHAHADDDNHPFIAQDRRRIDGAVGCV